MSKELSARDLLRKARERSRLEKQQQQQAKQKPSPAKRQRASERYEDQTSAGVSKMKIAEQVSLDEKGTAKRQKTEENADISLIFGEYASGDDSEDDGSDNNNKNNNGGDDSRENPHSNAVEPSNGLPAGFFDQGIEPSNDLDNMSEDEDESDRQEKQSDRDDSDPPSKAAPVEVLTLEQELAQFESEILKLGEAGTVKTAEDEIAEAGTRWSERAKNLALLRNQIKEQLLPTSPIIPDSASNSDSDSSDSEMDPALAEDDWRNSGLFYS